MSELLYTIFCVLTGMIGFTIYNNIFIAIVCFIFSPIAWLIWLCSHTVTLSIIKASFAWLFV